jgi:flagellar biosynthesis protein FlhF
MLVKRAATSTWGWDPAVAADLPEERGPAVIPFRLPRTARPEQEEQGAAPEERDGNPISLLLESDLPAEPWPQRPVLRREQVTLAEAAPRREEPAPARPQKEKTGEARRVGEPAFPRISRAEARSAPVAEPFRSVLQRYADAGRMAPPPASGDGETAAPAAPPQSAAARGGTPNSARTGGDAARDDARAPQLPRGTQSAAAPSQATSAAEHAFSVLTAAGLSDEIAEAALLEAVRVMPVAALSRSDRLVEVALARLVGGLPGGPALEPRALAGCQLVFFGTAGAGKTTMLLKTAALLRKAGGDIGIVGADVSHIGAREQLMRYGELLRLPVTIVYTPADLARAIAAAPPARITLVDTAACAPGPREPRPLRACAPELAALLDALPRRLPVLVLPAGTREADLARLANLARAAGTVAAAVTRLDEAAEAPARTELPAAGAALNALARLRLPPLLCSTGRNVLSECVSPGAMALAVAALESVIA